MLNQENCLLPTKNYLVVRSIIYQDQKGMIWVATEDGLHRIMNVINCNLSNPELNVEMISSEVGISRVHLYRKLKELTNQSILDPIRNVRM